MSRHVGFTDPRLPGGTARVPAQAYAVGDPGLDVATAVANGATGYLHNHARMWLASYVVHIRKVHWRTAADWLYGKSIPQAMDILPSALSLANIAGYEADLADPASWDAIAEHLTAELQAFTGERAIFIHNAMDQREQYEQGGRKPS